MKTLIKKTRISNMPKKPWQTRIAVQAAKMEPLAKRIAKKTESLPELFAGLGAEKPEVKYGCLKALRAISEREPAALYPEFGRFVDMLDSENTFLKWGAIIIIGNLAAVDSDNKVGRILDRYLAPISGSVMITAANTIGGAGKIARAKPRLADRIVRALLRVEAANYQTPECRNVALGHVVKSLELVFEHIGDPEPVLAFVQRQLDNSRNAVKKKAEAFLKKHGCLNRTGLQITLPPSLGLRRTRMEADKQKRRTGHARMPLMFADNSCSEDMSLSLHRRIRGSAS